MRRYLFIFPVLCTVALFSGCQSKVLRMLFEPQEFYNYAVTKGVTCTAPEMIDGDEKTRGYAAGRWIHLNLPTQKAIHRITIRGTNITSFMIYEKLEGEGRWRAIQQVQNNESPCHSNACQWGRDRCDSHLYQRYHRRSKDGGRV